MRLSQATWVATAFVAATAVVAFWAWTGLPAGAGVPINYLGLDGHRHHGSSREALWLIPAIAALVTASMTFAPNLGMRSGVERAAEPFDATLIGVAGLLFIVQTALIGRAIDADFNVMRPVAIATGVLLIGVGNYLGKAHRNGIFGLRTPWTLADASVWDKTHRFTGRAMFTGGVMLIALSFLLRNGAALGVSIGVCTALPLLAGVARSRSLAQAAGRGAIVTPRHDR